MKGEDSYNFLVYSMSRWVSLLNFGVQDYEIHLIDDAGHVC